MVQRRADGRFSKVVQQPNGTLRIPAILTRTGVFSYQRHDGSVQRELRHPDDVLRADSLATLHGAPLTDLHVKGGVKPSTWQKYAVGTVADNVGEDKSAPGHVAATINVSREDAVGMVLSKSREELSCGYDCDIDATPGTYNGESYDVRQRNIQYNHVALLPRGTARGGRSMVLRLDSSDDEVCGEFDNDSKQPGPPRRAPTDREDSMKIVIGGVEYDLAVDAKGAAAAIERLDGEHVAKLAALETRAKAAEERADSAEAELKTLSDPKTIQARVDARAQVVTDARKVAGEAELKLDGLSDTEIKRAAVVAKMGESVVDKKSDDFVAGVFSTMLASAGSESRDDSQSGPRSAMGQAPPMDQAPVVLPKSDAPWQKPLAVSRQR